MRPVIKSVHTDTAGNPLEFSDWGDAKPELIKELGGFCSYCEKQNSRSALDVEHTKGKSCKNTAGAFIYDHLKYRWDNFLLACKNCNSVKGKKDIAVSNPFMPHENNLLQFIECIGGGLIKIKSGVTGTDLARTQAFINLVGLGGQGGNPSYTDKDDRWEYRLKAFDLAKRQYDKYTAQPASTDLENIVNLAKLSGFFSVWYYRFKGLDEVRAALINGYMINGEHIIPFPGTHSPSFDAGNGYETLPRS